MNKNLNDENQQELFALRHTAEHVLTLAMKRLYPGIVEAMGPATDSGFYFDFEVPEGMTVSIDDFPKIEMEIAKIIKEDLPMTHREIDTDEAAKMFAHNHYKAEWVREISSRGEKAGIYDLGGQFIDLCAGPHTKSSGQIGAVKLLSVAGAYWRGDSKNKMLTRIYGTAFKTRSELDQFMILREEAEKRDHRKLGQQMKLFMFDPSAPGDAFWLPRGWKLYRNIIEFMRKRQEESGYIEISTPQIMDKSLWETSGHWGYYRENMFATVIEDRTFAIKPMNCPGGLLVYKSDIVSYRDLPMRVAEYGRVHRYEASGALHGLLRVRAFIQDDAHIFCTPDQLESEIQGVIKFMMDIYRDFGLEDVRIMLSTRPEKSVGEKSLWDRLEKVLADSLTKLGYKYEIAEGDGAFYGPKLDFQVKDSLGRFWQLGTVQADMNLPERFDISYIAEDGAKHRPIMLHRALIGSLERFLGAYLEITAGILPFWVAPLQVVVATIIGEANDYAAKVVDLLKMAGISAEADTRNEKIGYKIREHSLAKIPVMMVLGKKEAEGNKVSMRRLGNEAQETIDLQQAVESLKKQAALPGIRYQT